MPFDQISYNQALIHFKQKDEVIYNLMMKYGYVAPPPSRNLFANLIGNIIGQKIRFTQARQQRSKLFNLLGTHDFTLQQLLNQAQIHLQSSNQTKGDEIKEGLLFLIDLGIDSLRLEAIQNVCVYLKHNQLTSLEIDHLNDLLKLRGIGPWTIDCTKVMHNLYIDNQDFQNIILRGDLIIARGLKDLYKTTDITTLIDQKRDIWSPWNTMVTWYVWKAYTKI